MRFQIELTDTYAGQANYSWRREAFVTMPELTHYGYDGGTNYHKANKIFCRELMKKAKAAVGLTGIRGTTTQYGDMIEFRPYRVCQVMFIVECDE